MRKLLRGTTVALFSTMLLTSCSVFKPDEAPPLYEGKATVIEKAHIAQTELTFLENIFEDPEEIWEVELFIPESSVSPSSTIVAQVDEQSFESIEEGRIFCFSNANRVNTFIESNYDIDCEF